MKAQTINLQIVKNLGNYETIRLGGEWSVDKGESVEDAMTKAQEELLNAFRTLITKTKTEEEELKAIAKVEGKEFLNDLNKIQSVVNAIHEGRADMEKINKYYVYTNDTKLIFETACKLNPKKEK